MYERIASVAVVLLVSVCGLALAAAPARANSASPRAVSAVSGASLSCGYFVGLSADDAAPPYSNATQQNEGKVSAGVSTDLLVRCYLYVGGGMVERVKVQGGLTNSGGPTYEWVRDETGGSHSFSNKSGNVAHLFVPYLWPGLYRFEISISGASWRDVVGSGTPLTGLWSFSYKASDRSEHAMTLAETPLTVAVVDCLIHNDTNNGNYTSLQAAQDAAGAGDTLTVRGTCTGSAELEKDLTVTGVQPAGYGAPTLDALNHGRVLTIDGGATVTINALTITGGNSYWTQNGVGGGIYLAGVYQGPRATLTLNQSTISGNKSYQTGGGICSSYSNLIINESTISGNTAGAAGAIDSWDGTLTITNSTISGNSASVSNGGINSTRDTFLLSGSTVSDNHAGRDTGGIDGAFTMINSTVSGNTAGVRNPDGTVASVGNGGGIHGSVTMIDSTVSGNSATGAGGGIYGSATLNGASSIDHNSATQGGGLSGDGTLNDTSTITGNTAGNRGGGVYMRYAILTLNDSATVTGNSASSDGGGVYADWSSVIMKDSSTITGNTSGVTNPDGTVGIVGNGGGIYAVGGAPYSSTILPAAWINTGSAATISDNSATGAGGGIYVYRNEATHTLTFIWGCVAGGTVLSNTPDDIYTYNQP